ncbi:MAG: TetR/AcrR family transcriptional regulator [Sulfitobacter sp.]|nr:TetR/AcrR family transcriptional regulator [Sulfitobacter sp.]
MEDEPKPRRGRPSTLDLDQTLEVAMRAYWQADPADVSLNAICSLAGISKPALYRHFGGEDGFMRAVLDRYAQQVLSDIFMILQPESPLDEALPAVIRFASRDARMETGCVFFKMRAGKHRLGPQTRALVEEIDAAAVQAFEAYLESRRKAQDWAGDVPVSLLARYLVEQIGLALTQRAGGEAPTQVEASMTLALTTVRRDGPG